MALDIFHATRVVNDRDAYLSLVAQKPASWEPVHPALARLRWEDERTDVHAVVGGQYGVDSLGAGRYAFTCACGFGTGECATVLDASAVIILHAIHTCAVCQGEKTSRVAFGPMAGELDVFPRCSACAF